MSALNPDLFTALRLAGLMYLLLPATVWLVLRGSHDSVSLMAWCVGAALFGLGYVLIGLRDWAPDWLSIHVANPLVFASFALRVSSLRVEAGRTPAWRKGMLLVGLCTLLFMVAVTQSAGLRILISLLVQTMGTAWLAWTAAQLWRVSGLRVARAIAVAFAGLTLIMLWATWSIGLSGWPAPSVGATPLVTIAVIASLVVSLYGNLGFMGLIIERAHRQELLQARELERLAAQGQAAQQQAERLGAWLEERDEMLRLLAHEVRQPLNNASAALQAARKALQPVGLDSTAAGQRVQRAEIVLGQIMGTLDNTLAATALLASPDRVERRDADVDTLLALAIGDLDATQRARVSVHSEAAMRTALMDAGLMRLALRNLMSNALAYSPPGSPVQLRVSDCDEPLALLLEVHDQGQGVPPRLAERLFERGVRGTLSGPGHGLGLYVVRRVMELHGGSADLRPAPGGGTIFRLQLPQDMPDRRSQRRSAQDTTPTLPQPATSSPLKT